MAAWSCSCPDQVPHKGVPWLWGTLTPATGIPPLSGRETSASERAQTARTGALCFSSGKVYLQPRVRGWHLASAFVSPESLWEGARVKRSRYPFAGEIGMAISIYNTRTCISTRSNYSRGNRRSGGDQKWGLALPPHRAGYLET